MGSRTQKLLRKADLALSDIASPNGYLEDAQSAAFVRKLIDKPTLMKMARVHEMKAPNEQINKIQFASRILKKAPASGTAMSSGDRSKPAFENVRLSTHETQAEVWIPY